MPDFVITANGGPNIFQHAAFKDEVVSYSFDFSPWAEDNGAVSAVTWTRKGGQGALSAEALTANVASARMTFSQAGGTLIELVAAASTGQRVVVYLHVHAREPGVVADDYGISCG